MLVNFIAANWVWLIWVAPVLAIIHESKED